ncbi:MAG: VCBS repeat-containing protein [Balneolaceae bacterium]|nr:VCBS repeat-containing protein [Balneolaceae bacterium]
MLKLYVLFVVLFCASLNIEIYAQSPVVTYVHPQSGKAGTTITMVGINFDATASDNSMTLTSTEGRDSATVVATTVTEGNKYTFLVPAGLKGGQYTLNFVRASDSEENQYAQTFEVVTKGGNFGDGSGRQGISTPGSTNFVTGADIDGDGYKDIVYNTLSDSAMYWRLNNGDGTFGSQDTFSLGGFANKIYFPDINSDGEVDILVEMVNADPIWYLNNGNGSFAAGDTLDVNGSLKTISYGDFNNNGSLDFVALVGSSVRLFLNDGNNSFTDQGSLGFDSISGSTEVSTVTDLNGDGWLDYILTGSQGIFWCVNDGSGSFSIQTKLYNSGGINHISVGDVDLDGDIDIVAVESDDNDKLILLKNDGTSEADFTGENIATFNNAKTISIADMNGDGYPDVVSESDDGFKINWYENNRSGSFASAAQTISSPVQDPQGHFVADLDNDGDLDVVDISITTERIGVHLNIQPALNFKSITYDGAGDTVEISHSDEFDDLDEFTFEAWIKSDDASVRQGIAEKHVSPTSGWWIDLNNDVTAVLVTGDGVIAASSSENVSSNTWTHVAVTYNGSQLSVYLNGKDVTSGGAGTGTITNNSNSVMIGSLNWTSADFDGMMDEVRIWKVARSETEIQNNMFQPPYESGRELLVHYSFDKGSDSTLIDNSTYLNDATAIGDVTRSDQNHPNGTLITGDEGWRMLTVPVANVSYGELLDTLWTQGFTGSDSPSNGVSNVYTWSESSQNFASISNVSDIPAAGSSFIMYVYDDDDFDGSGDGFPKVILTDSTQRSDTLALSLSYTDTGTPADDGWNLVGNPYGATIYWDAATGVTSSNIDATFYVWSDSANSGAGDYLSWNGSTGTFSGGDIAPWQGIWVKANAASPSLTFTDEARSIGGILRKQAPVQEMRFTLVGDEMRSKTIMMFSKQASKEKDVLDAYKLQSLNEDYLSLFTQLTDGTGLDINALPINLEEEVSIPLAFDGSNLSGDFELKWNLQALPEEWTVTLFDNKTGEEINLREVEQYRFGLEATSKDTQNESEESTQTQFQPKHSVLIPNVLKAKQSSSRFTLVLNPNTSVSNEPDSNLPTSVELQQNYPNPFNPSTTISYGVPKQANVQLVVFDLLGRKVVELLNEPKSAGRYTVNFDASRLASGLYLYRLQVGSSVLIKKLTLIK